MMVGQQRLKDSGYGNLVFNENDNPENEEESTDIEVMLAPWTTSKNFILAAQNKGMIQLFGAGDSSGAGLAFSFLRSSMKVWCFLAYIDSCTNTHQKGHVLPRRRIRTR